MSQFPEDGDRGEQWRVRVPERLWTYRVSVEFEVSARTADEARGLVDEGLIGDAPAGTPAAVQ